MHRIWDFLSGFESKLSLEFVLNVLRQHEHELDKITSEKEIMLNRLEELIAKLGLLVNKVDELTDKMQDKRQP